MRCLSWPAPTRPRRACATWRSSRARSRASRWRTPTWTWGSRTAGSNWTPTKGRGGGRAGAGRVGGLLRGGSARARDRAAGLRVLGWEGRVSVAGEIELNDPQTLYRRWEDSQWSPFAIDLSTDREQWASMAGEDRDL